MQLGHLIAFIAALLAAMASPGPALLLSMSNTLRSGRMAGILTGFGLALMASCWTLAALLGLEAVFTAAPWAYGGLEIIGAGYLLWIAVKTWRGADVPLGPTPARARGPGARAFRQ